MSKGGNLRDKEENKYHAARHKQNKTMEQTIRNTYYYNVPAGVTPADHNVQYDHCVLVSCSGEDNYYMASARLEIENTKNVSEYLEDITGHYVEGVDRWRSAHEYLIDLVQGMAEELVRNTPWADEIKEYTAVIEESYPDGSYIVYSACIWADKLDQQLYINCSANLRDYVADREALKQMINVNAEDLHKRYL